jgi:hypothetical protein
MKARIALSALLAITALTAVACDDEDEDPNGPPDTNTFSATLNGANERPTPSTSTATATATFTSSTSGSTTTIQYTVTITGGTLSGPITAAHIHGPANASNTALPIVTLAAATGTTGVVISGSFTSTGNATINMAQLLTHMLAGNTYINLHTAANPDGEIRGQITD